MLDHAEDHLRSVCHEWAMSGSGVVGRECAMSGPCAADHRPKTNAVVVDSEGALAHARPIARREDRTTRSEGLDECSALDDYERPAHRGEEVGELLETAPCQRATSRRHRDPNGWPVRGPMVGAGERWAYDWLMGADGW